MPGTFVDNVGGLTSTTTTGAYQSFSAWGQADAMSTLSNGTYAYKAIPYPATPAEPSEYETGEGTWNGSTLTRDTVKTSSNGGSAVDWTGQRVLVVIVADTAMLTQYLTGVAWGDITGTLSDQTDLQTALDGKQNHENGFVDASQTTMSFTDGTRTFSIGPDDPTYTEYVVYSQGTKYTKTGDETLVIPDSEGLHFIYFDENGDLASTQTFTPDIITLYAFCMAVYWDADNSLGIIQANERHGATMDSATHSYNHNTFGARYGSGLALGNLDVDGSGNDATAAQFSVADGVIYDEDIRTTITDGSPQELSTIAEIPVLYRSGANGYWRKVDATTYPLTTPLLAESIAGEERPAWNNVDEGGAGVWGLTEVANNDFVCYHYFATPDVNTPIIAIMGQAEYATISAAREGAETEINGLLFGDLDSLSLEYVAIATVIYETKDSYTNAVKARVRSTDTGDSYIDWRAGIKGGGATASSGVWGAITGTLSDQTDLQTALDAKADLAGDTFTGDISVPDEAYGVGWNGSLEVPTKNAVYDEMEGKEPAFSKNTGFNLNLGTTSGTVSEGDHTHPASDIVSGTLAHERGGLEADVSAYSGLIKISGGATSQAVAGTDYLTDVVQDTTPQLGGTLDCQNEDIHTVREIEIGGQTTDYTTFEKAFIYIDQNHGIDNDNGLGGFFGGAQAPSATFLEGTYTFKRDASLVVSGFLFYALPTVKNDSGSNRVLSPFYTLSANPTFQADAATVTHNTQTDIQVAPTFTTTGTSPQYNLTNHNEIDIKATYEADVAVTHRNGVAIRDAAVTDANGLTRQVGIAMEALDSGDNNANIVLGQGVNASFTGDYGIYQADSNPQRWGGGQQYAITETAATTVNATRDDHIFVCTANSAITFNLPDSASAAPNDVNSGQTFKIRAHGTGTVTVTATGSDAVGGTATITSGNSATVSLGTGTTWYMFP